MSGGVAGGASAVPKAGRPSPLSPGPRPASLALASAVLWPAPSGRPGPASAAPSSTPGASAQRLASAAAASGP
eukprot:1717014-Alexandrium_andersonii.AAC.1